jgi:hypothetical protein
VEVIEREEWLIVMGMLGDSRSELESINKTLREDDDEEEAEEDS